ncbi:MAG: Autotransporter adhesin [Parcubacteria bacterium C7867-001]|nr:MAG: Autotransporter adhesin [Parcubacteria bacterium C7867-001]
MKNLRGFSTLEMLIAMTVLILSLSAVLMLFPGIQSGAVDTEMNAEALGVAGKMIENEQALSRKDFRLVLATTSTETIGGTLYTKTITVDSVNFYTKHVTALVAWGGMYGRGQKVELQTVVSNFSNIIGGDTCDSIVTGNWSFPFVVNPTKALLGADILGDSSGLYPITDVDAHQQRLYVAVNTPSVTPAARNTGTSVSDSAGGTVSWNNPSNALSSDNNYTTASLSSSQTTRYLKATNFGFSIPQGATILGVQVDIERKGSSSTNTVRDSVVRLVKPDGSLSSANRANTSSSWPTSDGTANYGNTSDLWGENYLSASDINNSAFGVVLSATSGSGFGSRTASVDNVKITVTYINQFYVLNVSNHSVPTLRGGLANNSVNAGINAVAVATTTNSGNFAFVATNSTTKQLQAIDVTPTIPLATSTWSVPSGSVVARSIFYKDGYVFLGLANNPSGPEFYVIDVHNPLSIPATPLGTYEVGAGINAIYVRSARAYLATDDTNRELIALDLEDLAHPTLRGVYDAAGSTGGQGKSLYTVGNTLYLGRYYSLNNAAESLTLDVTNATPTLTSSYDIGTSGNTIGVYDTIIRGSLAFLLTGNTTGASGKVQIASIAANGSMNPGAAVTLPSSAAGTALDCEDNYLFAASVPTTGGNANKGSISIITAP